MEPFVFVTVHLFLRLLKYTDLSYMDYYSSMEDVSKSFIKNLCKHISELMHVTDCWLLQASSEQTTVLECLDVGLLCHSMRTL